MRRVTPKRLKMASTALLVGATLITLTAGQALAAGTIANSSGTAIGGNVIDTGACVTSNSGGATTQTVTAAAGGIVNLGLGCTGNGVGQGTQSGALVAASAAVQTGSADAAGSSSACAGVTGPGGGVVQVGNTNPCTVNPGTGSGVTLLNSLVTATAAYSICTITAGGTPVATPVVVGLALGSLLTLLSTLGTVSPLGVLNPTPVPGGTTTTISLTPLLGGAAVPLLSLTLNNVSTTAGVITSTAVDLKVLPGLLGLGSVVLGTLGLGSVTSGLEVILGTVTCGPNAVPLATSTLPGKALPIAGGIVILAGGAAYLGRRRLFAGFARSRA